MVECLEKIADIMIGYYKPFQLIETKYKNKVTAIGLLKEANMGVPHYLLPYYQRLMDYKLLIKDHTDNLKMAHNIAMEMFQQILIDVFRSHTDHNDPRALEVFDWIIELLFPHYQNADRRLLEEMKKRLLSKYNTPEKLRLIAEKLLTRHLDIDEKYDLLAKLIVKKCLSGVTREEVSSATEKSVFNFFVYGHYSRAETNNIYNVNVQVQDEIRSLKFFTKIKLLVWAVTNTAQNYLTTVHFFGRIFDNLSLIDELFAKYPNIKLKFY